MPDPDREALGRAVTAAVFNNRQIQPDWEALPAGVREMHCRIAETLYRLGYDAAQAERQELVDALAARLREEEERCLAVAQELDEASAELATLRERWQPMSAPPTTPGRYLVVGPDGVETDEWVRNIAGNWVWDYYADPANVRWWRPLPEPPEEPKP